jgi:hypothetical protein
MTALPACPSLRAWGANLRHHRGAANLNNESLARLLKLIEAMR